MRLETITGGVRLETPAKINLYLRVIRRREDNYHEIESLIQKVGLCDRVTLLGNTTGSITLRCPGSNLPEDEGNLVYRAADLLIRAIARKKGGDHGQGIDITLEKRIPVAAGLGGGSSDAAATLQGLNHLHGDIFSQQDLQGMALVLGADVPLFLHPAAALWARGIGEQLQEAPGLAGYCVVLVNPGFPVSTRWVYQNLPLTTISQPFKFQNFDGSVIRDAEQRRAIFSFSDFGIFFNDLEQVTMLRYPEISRIKQLLHEQGATATLMSGSGPTVFALFPESQWEKAERCSQILGQLWEKTFLLTPWN